MRAATAAAAAEILYRRIAAGLAVRPGGDTAQATRRRTVSNIAGAAFASDPAGTATAAAALARPVNAIGARSGRGIGAAARAS